MDGLGGKPQATVIGTGIVTSAVNAALANGMAAHGDETDDSHLRGRFHPGCGIVPAALATAELAGRSGNDLLCAVALGYDSGAPRYVGTDATLALIGDAADYRFGDQTAVSVGATVRAAYTFTPELSLQFYTQLFAASVHYGPFFVCPKVGFRERVDIDALIPAGAPATNPDSEQATLNVNLVLRWEYRLGSTLFCFVHHVVMH